MAERRNTHFLTAFNEKKYFIAKININNAIKIQSGNAVYYSNAAILFAKNVDVEFNTTNTVVVKAASSNTSLLDTIYTFFNAASELNPFDAGFKHNLAWIYFLRGDTANTINYFNKAINLDPSCALYHLSLGIVYEAGYKTTQAFQSYGIAIRLSPEILESHFFRNLKMKYPIKTDSLLLASRHYLEEKVHQTNSPIFKARLGKLYLSQNDYELARNSFLDVTKQLPNLNRPWFYLGLIYEMDLDTASFKSCYQRSLLLDPRDFLPNLQMANYYYKFDSKASLAYYKNVLNNWCRLYSDHYYKSTRIYDSKGVFNDIFPQSLLQYTKPAFDRKFYCKRISCIYLGIGDTKNANYYLEISNDEIPVNDILNTQNHLFN